MRIAVRRGRWTAQDVKRELRRFCIGAQDAGGDRENLYFAVNPLQASWAEYVLRRAGAPVTTVVDARNALWAAGKGPIPAWDGTPFRLPTGERQQAQPTPRTAGAFTVGSGSRADRLLTWLEGRDKEGER